MRILRHLAEHVGAQNLSRETGVVVVPLEGFDNRRQAEAFGWLTEDLFDRAVQVFAILDRDYRTEGACDSVVGTLRGVGVHAHVWNRKELES